MINVAINGLGRIGRAAAKLLLDEQGVELVAINDLASIDNLAYLLKYDTVYGRYQGDVTTANSQLTINGHEIQILNKEDPAQLPWGELGIDVVIESTGHFEDRASAQKHVQAGAKAVIISAPSKGDNPAPTFIRGVNDEEFGDARVINNGSCTTNAIAPTIEVLETAFGVERALMTTVHGYTATQGLVDGPGGKDARRGRAAAANIVPTSTGAAISTGEAIPALKGRFDGIALRVPVLNGSIADITAILKRDTTVEEVNQAFVDAAATEKFKGILEATNDPIVSSDIIGNPHSAVVDLGLTRVLGNLVKVFAWYDNELAYAHRLVELAVELGGSLGE